MSLSFRSLPAVCAICFFTLSAAGLRADELQMQNGDRYLGKILSVSSNSVTLQSDVLGKLTLPRNKVSVVMFAGATSNAPTTPATAPAPVATANLSGTNADLSAAFRSLGANTNFIQQVRGQMLTGAAPEANQKFDELLDGLMTGKLNLNDLRNQAKTSIDEINDLKRELGPEAGDSLNSYLGILENFVNETATTDAPVQATISPQPAPQIK
jgi:hypothetical protein